MRIDNGIIRRAIEPAVSIAFAVLAAIPVAALWWRAWMYQGWPGPPPFLALFMHTDGEASYDRVFLEILVLAWIAIAASLIAGRRLLSERRPV